MNSQSLRITFAFLLSFASLVGVVILAIIQVAIPELLQVISLGSTTYLFGVITNGSGIPKPPANGAP